MISGATGAIAAVTVPLAHDYGVEYLFVAVLYMGLFQFIFYLIKLDNIVRLIPNPVMMGFCNGLAIIIGVSQFSLYKHAPTDDDTSRRLSGGTFDVFNSGGWISGAEAAWAVFLTLIAFTICVVFPLYNKAIPSSLISILTVTAIEWAIVRTSGSETQLVQDFASIESTFPTPVWFDSQYSMPNIFDKDVFTTVAPYSIVMAIVGIIESLMTLTLVDELTQTRGSGNKEVFGQSIANIICGMFAGMGGCVTIGQAMINVQSGARSRISSFSAGFFLFVVIW
jgi:SulP family sulfate permease